MRPRTWAHGFIVEERLAKLDHFSNDISSSRGGRFDFHIAAKAALESFKRPSRTEHDDGFVQFIERSFLVCTSASYELFSATSLVMSEDEQHAAAGCGWRAMRSMRLSGSTHRSCGSSFGSW